MPAPDTVLSLIALAMAYREYDAGSQLLEQQAHAPICLRCGKCCENVPIAYGVEAANAVSHLIGQGRLYGLQRRIEGWLLDRHTACTIYRAARTDKVSFGIESKLQAEVLALAHTPCPFYEDKACLLHDARPLVCRAFGVTRSATGCPRPNQIILAQGPRADLKAEVDAVLELVPKPTWKHAGFFPTLIFAHAWPETFSRYVADGMIASAKLTMTYPSFATIFEEDAQRISNSPVDLFHKQEQKTLVWA